MKKIKLYLAGLIVALVFTQIAATTSDVSSFDYMTDVNRDGTVDIHDLNRLGKVYGSSLVLPSEPNKTVVIVLSFDKEPPEEENARAAIVDPDDLDNQRNNPINVTYTNSSGIAAFDLSSNKNYTAIAWSGSAHNYANFTTNSLGEASVAVLLGEPSLPPVRSLPQRWVVLTFIDNETGSLSEPGKLGIVIVHYIFYDYPHGWSMVAEAHGDKRYGGIYVIPPKDSANEPHSTYGLYVKHFNPDLVGSQVYSPDENGCANVIVYVSPG